MARALAAPRDTGDDDESDDDGSAAFAALGGTLKEAMAALRDRHEPEAQAIEVWEENEPALNWFLSVMTQWRRAAMSGLPIGLDYAGVGEAARLLGMNPTPALFSDLQVMELAYSRECVRRAPAPRPGRR